MTETPLLDLLHNVCIDFQYAYPMLYHDREKVVIQVPRPFLYLLRDEVANMPFMGNNELSTNFDLMGYKIQVGYEMAVVMYHQDCTLFLDNAPVIKVPLMPGASLPDQGETYNRVIFKITKLNFGGGKISLN